MHVWRRFAFHVFGGRCSNGRNESRHEVLEGVLFWCSNTLASRACERVLFKIFHQHGFGVEVVECCVSPRLATTTVETNFGSSCTFFATPLSSVHSTTLTTTKEEYFEDKGTLQLNWVHNRNPSRIRV